MAPPASFRINSRRFLLTYAQANIDLHDFIVWLQSLQVPVTRAIVCRELHQDGNEHVHAAVEFERRVNTTRVSIFDYEGYHPNISASRSWAACVNYCRKEGVLEVAYHGCEAEDAAMERGGVPSDGASAYEHAESATTIREWFEYCIDKNISYAFANSIWNQLHGPRAPTFFLNNLEGRITAFELQVLQWTPDFHTLVLCGPSKAGKTSWALRHAPTPFLLVTDIDDLGWFDPAVHKCIVFDEIRCTGDEITGRGAWPLTSQIKLVTWDTPVSIRIRYKVAHIPRNVPKIFSCCNWLPFHKDEQIDRRISIVNMYPERSNDDLYFVRPSIRGL